MVALVRVLGPDIYIYIIYSPNNACVWGFLLLCKEVESSVGVRAWWTLGLRLGLGLRAEGWG